VEPAIDSTVFGTLFFQIRSFVASKMLYGAKLHDRMLRRRWLLSGQGGGDA
jgi:hypothetical protein